LAAVAAPLDFAFGPQVALLGVATHTDEGVAGVECKACRNDDEQFHAVDLLTDHDF